MSKKELTKEKELTYLDFKNQILTDYKTMVLSRETSILGRREVLTGKAKFGIFGDGKELPQIVLSKFFKNGDFRSGYYRDQTILMSQGHLSVREIFSALYANTDNELEPMSGGRQMGGHFVTRSIDEEGNYLNLVNQKNHSSDISPVAGQIPRLIGLGQASKIYRKLKISNSEKFSKNGNEIAWGTIGNAATSEGIFFESFNAAGVIQIPIIISVWDDEYGISVHNNLQTTKESISEALSGFQRNNNFDGFEILTVNGWDYSALIETYSYAEKIARNNHVPVLIHVKELTQPLGHSSSGSHQRYKSDERLEWEKEYDCNKKMKEWIISNGIADEKSISEIEQECKEIVKDERLSAWKAFQKPILKTKDELLKNLDVLLKITENNVNIKTFINSLKTIQEPNYKDLFQIARKSIIILSKYNSPKIENFKNWYLKSKSKIESKYNTHLYSQSNYKLSNVSSVKPEFDDTSKLVDGRLILRDNFDALLSKNDKIIIFGQDVGVIGDVNQGLEGIQKKHGEDRIFDTGIRESSIIGQGIGLALRGLRPIAEIQYLDYILYCISTLSDDLASYHYRTIGKQSVPLIIRTRGHRLEGIWHSGSPLGGIINLLRGINILVPRNMTQAAGFYNSLLESDEPGIIIEPLNGYRIKEKMPINLGEFKIKIGEVEKLTDGNDITIISYGSTLRIIQKATDQLKEHDISCEIIDIQCLFPFDTKSDIIKSIKKTNRVLIVDEDVPGGSSGFILQQLINNQNIFNFLDSPPLTLTAKDHRPAYGTDGDYFSKPSSDDIFEKIYSVMTDFNPKKYPKLF